MDTSTLDALLNEFSHIAQQLIVDHGCLPGFLAEVVHEAHVQVCRGTPSVLMLDAAYTEGIQRISPDFVEQMEGPLTLAAICVIARRQAPPPYDEFVSDRSRLVKVVVGDDTAFQKVLRDRSRRRKHGDSDNEEPEYVDVLDVRHRERITAASHMVSYGRSVAAKWPGVTRLIRAYLLSGATTLLADYGKAAELQNLVVTHAKTTAQPQQSWTASYLGDSERKIEALREYLAHVPCSAELLVGAMEERMTPQKPGCRWVANMLALSDAVARYGDVPVDVWVHQTQYPDEFMRFLSRTPAVVALLLDAPGVEQQTHVDAMHRCIGLAFAETLQSGPLRVVEVPQMCCWHRNGFSGLLTV